MTSKRYPYLTQQLPFRTTATLRNPTRLPDTVDLRTLSSNPLLTRELPKAGGSSEEARRLDRVNRVQDELVKRRERFEKRDATRRRLSDDNRRRTAQMELDNIETIAVSRRIRQDGLQDLAKRRTRLLKDNPDLDLRDPLDRDVTARTPVVRIAGGRAAGGATGRGAAAGGEAGGGEAAGEDGR